MKEPVVWFVFVQLWGIALLYLFVRGLRDPKWIERGYQTKRKLALKWFPWAIERDDEPGGELYRLKKYRVRNTFLFAVMFFGYVAATIDAFKKMH